MTYSIRLHPKVARFLKKAGHQLADRLTTRLRRLQEQPFRYLEHYGGEGVYKLRLGEYRALIDVDQSRRIIFVRVLDHRRRIYKRTGQ